MRFLLPLFLALSAWAQPDPIWKKLIAVPSSSPQWIPSSDNTIWLWWNYQDLTVGNNVNLWIDRISSFKFFQTVTARQPTNSSLGVYFSGSTQYLTNSPTTFNRNQLATVCIIFRPFTPASDASTVFGGDGSAGLTGNRSLQTYTTGALHYQGDGGDVAFGHFGSGTEIDWAIYLGSLNQVSIWTNGVLAVTNSTSSGMDIIGLIGGRLDVSRFYKGYIREIIWYTNTTFNPTLIANLHKYATNTYGFTP